MNWSWLPFKIVRRDEDHRLGYARVLVKRAEIGMTPGTSGEYKRHHVLAEMKKMYPNARDRELGMLIELAVQEMP